MKTLLLAAIQVESNESEKSSAIFGTFEFFSKLNMLPTFCPPCGDGVYSLSAEKTSLDVRVHVHCKIVNTANILIFVYFCRSR